MHNLKLSSDNHNYNCRFYQKTSLCLKDKRPPRVGGLFFLFLRTVAKNATVQTSCNSSPFKRIGRPVPILHAPTKGATQRLCQLFLTSQGFNPRTHKGCDFEMEAYNNQHDEFQSTHPQRVRLYKVVAKVPTSKFQSTHPQRVRHYITNN